MAPCGPPPIAFRSNLDLLDLHSPCGRQSSSPISTPCSFLISYTFLSTLSRWPRDVMPRSTSVSLSSAHKTSPVMPCSALCQTELTCATTQSLCVYVSAYRR